MRFVFFISIFIILSSRSFAAAGDIINTETAEKKKVDTEERVLYLTKQCEILLKKADWITSLSGKQLKAYRLNEGYDEMLLQFDATKSDGNYTFSVSINKNQKQTTKTFKLGDETARDDNRLRDIVLSAVLPYALVREGNGDFRKAYTSVFSIGYARTNENRKCYPALVKGGLHFSWQLLYDPSLNILSQETPLRLGDYFSFQMYFDLEKAVKENFFNIDLLIYGKNKYKGSKDNGTRIMYGFFNGLEYFRPGFSDSIMKWDSPIYKDRPYIQYGIWRALQGNILISHTKGASVYSAEVMAGAGMGVGPSSLFLAGTIKEEEQYMSESFRSVRYRKQNYYFSYTLPARISITADHVCGFRFEAGYNYYFFCPVLRDNFYDMLHMIKGSIGYYIAKDVMLSAQYERWRVKSMMHNATMAHHWNRLIIEFRNYF